MNISETLNYFDVGAKILRIKQSVDVEQEVAALIKNSGTQPILFEQVKEYPGPILANIFSGKADLSSLLNIPLNQLNQRLVKAIDSPTAPAQVPLPTDLFQPMALNLNLLPILRHFPFDGGKYITSGVVIISDREYGLNASFHRMMVLGQDRLVLRIVPRHLAEYIHRGNREIAICIGTPLQVQIAAAISCEIEKSELSIANALKPFQVYPLEGHLIPDSEIVLLGTITSEFAPEGPFLDLTETIDLVREQPVAKISKIYSKQNYIYQALLPGGPEHRLLMGMPREATIFREVSQVCQCVDVALTPGGCNWLHAVIQIIKKGPEDPYLAIEAAFKGHGSLKHVWVVDPDINIHSPQAIDWAFATRFQGDRQIRVFPSQIGSSLDPSADPGSRKTCKLGFDLTIPLEPDPGRFVKPDYQNIFPKQSF